ncbi:MAG: aminotransferase class I/II-fold pyridoxal phosphate-dependent enzyme, partial [Mucispirillum sp.]|nr:aminotransferase class I/II-fold pyridoxal phosphate-dependent enzyme [Mucispirillum sp.]
MNPIAKNMNETLSKLNKNILDMLSDTGKNIFMPKGILSQSAEAKEKAHKFNATIGISTSRGKPLYLKSMYEKFKDVNFESIFPYAPAAGVTELRNIWREKIIRDNPSLKNTQISLPIVSHALTNGLATVGELFINRGDYVVLPDMFWGNYRLMFGVRLGGELATYKTFSDDGGYNVAGFLQTVRECGAQSKKVIVILNFPNNPSGYSLTKDEAKSLADGLTEIAESGINIVAVSDDAYFGLFFEDNIFKESLFALLAGRSERLLAVKTDGITKESFAWGFRIGFITYGATIEGNNDEILKVLEAKTTGFIRSTISSCSHPAQSIALETLKSPNFMKEKNECGKIIEKRCLKVKEILNTMNYQDQFSPYPFNSGYFMCVKLAKIDAETLRTALLDKYGIGVISVNQTDIRIAFSSVDEENLQELFDTVYK